MPFLYGDLGGAIVVGHSTQINGCCVKMVMVILMLIIDLRVRKAVEAQWRRRNYLVPDIIFGQVCIIINILLLARRIFAPSVKSMSYNSHETIARELVLLLLLCRKITNNIAVLMSTHIRNDIRRY